MPRQKCNVCESKKSCEVCVEFWRREKRRNRCPSCNQLHWIRVLFEDCQSDICSGISNEYQELPKCPTIQLFFEDPAKITVGNFINLYSVAQFSRFAAERSKWIHSTFIRDLPACECVYPIRHLTNLTCKDCGRVICKLCHATDLTATPTSFGRCRDCVLNKCAPLVAAVLSELEQILLLTREKKRSFLHLKLIRSPAEITRREL
jgi:hypothetical protein